MTTATANPFLEGNFAPIREEITNDRLTVIGELPTELRGMYVRNGPNPQFSPIGQYHWFDGDGMLHAVQIEDGKATYRNRYVRTRGYKIEHNAGKAVWTGLLEPPQPDNPYGPGKNVANTALIWHAGQLLALWEGGEPHAVQLPQLDTIEPKNYEGKLVSAFTAHPKVDPVSGEMMFIGYSLARPPYLQYSIVSASGELLRTVPIDLPVGVIMHDFAVTEHYTLFMDLPLAFRPERLQQGEPALTFERERSSRFGILPRHGDNSDIRWFESPACYIFHTLNAFEAGDEIVLIGCRMTSTSVLSSSSDPDSDIPRLYQWRFNLSTGNVQETLLDNTASEFPRINEQQLGRKTRYGYTAKSAPERLPLFSGLIKYDFEQDTSQTHEFGTGRYGGEAVFVPRPSAAAEDDGWLVTFVYDRESETSELLIVEAQNFTGEPVARVILPQRVPYGFHGTWVGAEEIN